MRKIIGVLELFLFISLSQSEPIPPNCLSDPTNPACENYILPNVTSHINKLCSMMPYMPGCTVSRECTNGHGTGPYCEPFSNLKEICTEMGGMMGCEDYNSLCQPSNTKVKECQVPILPLPSQNKLRSQITTICNEMDMAFCDWCPHNSQCDVLLVYSALCFSMAGMSECSYWHQICELVPKWGICDSVPVPNCLTNPWLTGCENYILPNVTSDVNMLCTMMPYMPGCTISRECANGRGTGPYCEPFSNLKEICTEMGDMMGCEDYNSICQPNNTKVVECKTKILPLPSQTFLSTQISEMCLEMAMPDCERCPHSGQCDVLLVYSALCFSMPGMPQCSAWHQICGLIPGWVLCTGEPDKLQPIMRMYFHTDIVDYILFSQWVPRDALSYAISVLGVIAIAFFHEFLRTTKTIVEYKLRKRESQKFRETTPLQTQAHYPEARYPPFEFSKEFFRALLRTLDTTLHFLIMLITMTFNVGLFVGVMVGYGLGYLAFGRFLRPLEPLILTGLGEEEICH